MCFGATEAWRLPNQIFSCDPSSGATNARNWCRRRRSSGPRGLALVARSDLGCRRAFVVLYEYCTFLVDLRFTISCLMLMCDCFMDCPCACTVKSGSNPIIAWKTVTTDDSQSARWHC
jgi:hypothetical protein